MIRHIHQARFVSWIYLMLLIVFSLLALVRPAAGLAGLGSLLILAALMVEANRDVIWNSYVTAHPADSKPNRRYYTLNVYLAWPLVLIAGVLAVWAACVID